MQGKLTNLENFPSQERKQKQKSLLTSTIRKQKKKKRLKNKRPEAGSGWDWEASSDRLGNSYVPSMGHDASCRCSESFNRYSICDYGVTTSVF